MKNKYFIGIDGGATKTVGVLFNQDGDTLSSHVDLGSNLTIDEEKSTNLIINLINTLIEKTKIKIDDIFQLA